MVGEMKISEWLLSEVRFKVVNRWRDWIKYPNNLFIIWFGMEFLRGGEYNIRTERCFDLTIFNFGFVVRVRLKPDVSEYQWSPEFVEKLKAEKRRPTKINKIGDNEKHLHGI